MPPAPLRLQQAGTMIWTTPFVRLNLVQYHQLCPCIRLRGQGAVGGVRWTESANPGPAAFHEPPNPTGWQLPQSATTAGRSTTSSLASDSRQRVLVPLRQPSSSLVDSTLGKAKQFVPVAHTLGPRTPEPFTARVPCSRATPLVYHAHQTPGQARYSERGQPTNSSWRVATRPAL